MRLLTSSVIVFGLLVATGAAQSDSDKGPLFSRDICLDIERDMMFSIGFISEMEDGSEKLLKMHKEAVRAGDRKRAADIRAFMADDKEFFDNEVQQLAHWATIYQVACKD